MSILLQKTASLCSVSCRLGACGWERSTPPAWRLQNRRALSSFGKYLGLAFQIYDDWLDYWGDEQVGKTLGTDLVQLKPTLPLIRLLTVASDRERQQLRELLAIGDAQALRAVCDELKRSDASEYTLGAASRYVAKAKTALAGLQDSPAKECLMKVAEFSVRRTK